MTRANSTQSSPAPKKPSPKQAATDFEKPDSEQAAEGAPEHEQSLASRASTGAAKHDDARHGYSQDSGYQSSGGNGHEGKEQRRDDTAVSDESRTPVDDDASRAPRK